MHFAETRISGAWIIELDKLGDERGFFARAYCQHEFEAHGLNIETAQCNVSFNRLKGTLRGMHYQDAPHAEAKLVRCTRGAVYDVVLDLRADSPTYTQWVATELTAATHRMVYIPEGCAHGYQTLQDDCEVFYQVSAFYHPELYRGVQWDDPAFGITWPIREPILSARDRSYPPFAR